jgi:hypothetical protein
LVERGHQQTEASREKMKELARKREEAGKREHDQKLLREYARAEMQQVPIHPYRERKGNYWLSSRKKPRNFRRKNNIALNNYWNTKFY